MPPHQVLLYLNVSSFPDKISVGLHCFSSDLVAKTKMHFRTVKYIFASPDSVLLHVLYFITGPLLDVFNTCSFVNWTRGQ